MPGDLMAKVLYKDNGITNPWVTLVGVDDRWCDAFGRLRVSNTSTLFEASFTYDTQPLLFEEITTAGGTVTQANAALTLEVDGTADGFAAVQSRNYLPYEKGKSQLVKMTFVLGAPTADVTKRVGYFDPEDGFFLQQTGDGLSLVRRTSTTGALVETVISQADWNIDPLDGTGASGVTLDPDRAQIMVLDGQWLGVGRVRVAFSVDGLTLYVHEFLHANREAVAPYTRTFTLPVRYEIATTAPGAAATMTAICCDVESEGGVDSPSGFNFATANEADVTTSTTPAAVLSIRPAADYPAGGRSNRTFIVPGDVSVLVGGQPCLIQVQYDAVLAGGTWTRADGNSAVEVGVGQTITTPGLVVDTLFVPAGSGNVRAAAGDSVASQYPLTLDVAGVNPKALTVVATAVSGTGTVRAATGWREIR